jgi:hypothetical protein
MQQQAHHLSCSGDASHCGRDHVADPHATSWQAWGQWTRKWFVLNMLSDDGVLVDHAFIVAGREITKAARNWLGEALDAAKRSQITFMDRNDILNLYTVTNLSLSDAAQPVLDPWGSSAAGPPF